MLTSIYTSFYLKITISNNMSGCQNFQLSFKEITHLTNISNGFQSGFFEHVCGSWGGHISY